VNDGTERRTRNDEQNGERGTTERNGEPGTTNRTANAERRHGT
jgi:hypothetical protein